jgi:hypothetical protein
VVADGVAVVTVDPQLETSPSATLYAHEDRHSEGRDFTIPTPG